MEHHKARLNLLCRTCGEKISGAAVSEAKKFETEISLLYHINVDSDQLEMHPPRICSKCRYRLERIKKAKSEGKAFEATFTPVAKFTAHSDSNCMLCLGSQRGRPAKRRAASQMVLEKGEKKVPSDSDDSSSEHSQDPENQMEVEDDNIPLVVLEKEHEELELKGKTSAKKTLFPETTTVLVCQPNSIPLERFINTQNVTMYVCKICKGVSCTAYKTVCGHSFCKACLLSWVQTSAACPACFSCLDSGSGNTEVIYLDPETVLKEEVTCMYKSNGCKQILKLEQVSEHESECKFVCPQKVERRPERRQSLLTCDRQYVKSKRLKDIIESTNSFCEDHQEDKGDVLFFLLRSHLYDQGQLRQAAELENIWKGATDCLSVDECLALRVEKLETKNQYKKEHDFLKQHGSELLSSPNSLNAREKEYMPPAARWSLVGTDPQQIMHLHHTPAKIKRTCGNTVASSLGGTDFEPIDVLRDFPPNCTEIPTPNCRGVRWGYPDALAKTLEELDDLISSSLSDNDLDPNDPDIIVHTVVKDGADGMGDIDVHREAADRFLPGSAFRFSFAILQCSVTVHGKQFVVFKEKSPNSVRVNRPLLQVIADENNRSSVAICMTEIEAERSYMKDKIFEVHIPGKGLERKHQITFYTSMVDEKFDRKEGGLAGAGSKFLCTLCEATRTSAKTEIGSFVISRTISDITEAAEVRRVNVEGVPEAKLDELTKGVKSKPLLRSEPRERGIDATHADINLATYTKKIIIREMAKVTKWEASADIQPLLQNAERELDLHWKGTFGINPQLMMPGNYARVMFDPANADNLLSLIPNEDRRRKLAEILEIFRALRKVYRANEPAKEFPEQVSQFKEKAVEMGKALIEHFEYVPFTNYMHKIIEHTQEILEDPCGVLSVGALSGEGNEAGNKVFRHFRKHHSRKGNVFNGMRDVLWLHWLYSSPRLRHLAETYHRENRCTLCHGAGHSRRTCERTRGNGEGDN